MTKCPCLIASRESDDPRDHCKSDMFACLSLYLEGSAMSDMFGGLIRLIYVIVGSITSSSFFGTKLRINFWQSMYNGQRSDGDGEVITTFFPTILDWKNKNKNSKKNGCMPKTFPQAHVWQNKEDSTVRRQGDYKCKIWIWFGHTGDITCMEPKWRHDMAGGGMRGLWAWTWTYMHMACTHM